MLAQITDLRLCALISMRPYVPMPLCPHDLMSPEPYVPAPLCLRTYVLHLFVCALVS